MNLLRLVNSGGHVFGFLSPGRPGVGAGTDGSGSSRPAGSSREMASSSRQPNETETELQDAFLPSSSSSSSSCPRDGESSANAREAKELTASDVRDTEAQEPVLGSDRAGEAEEESPVQCRICLESEGGQLIAPCSCKGSSKYVHRECLDQWRSTKEGKAFSQCTTCRERFYLSVQQPKMGARAAKFGCLVTRDTLLLAVLAQLVVCLYAFGAFYLDTAMGSPLRISCGIRQRSVLLFYYVFGLFIFLFVAGLLGRQLTSAQREQHTLVVLTVRRPRNRRRRSLFPSAAIAPSSGGAADVPRGNAAVESDTDIYQGQASGRVHLSPRQGRQRFDEEAQAAPFSSWWGQHIWGVPGAGRGATRGSQGQGSTDPDTLEAAHELSDTDQLLSYGRRVHQGRGAGGVPGAPPDLEAGVDGGYASSGAEGEERAALAFRHGGVQGVYQGAGLPEDEEAAGEGAASIGHPLHGHGVVSGQGVVRGEEDAGQEAAQVRVGEEGVREGGGRRGGEREERRRGPPQRTGQGPARGQPRRGGAAGAGAEGRRAQEERQVLLRFRHSLQVTPEAVFAGSFVAFFVGFLAVAVIELGVVQHRLDGFFVVCLAVVTAPTGVLYSLRLLRNVWDCHRCVLTKRRLTEEYQVEDLDNPELPPRLPEDRVKELQTLGLW